MAREKTKAEKLFSAAVLRRSFELQDGEYRQGFKFVYEGVLRDLGLLEPEIAEDAFVHEPETLPVFAVLQLERAPQHGCGEELLLLGLLPRHA